MTLATLGVFLLGSFWALGVIIFTSYRREREDAKLKMDREVRDFPVEDRVTSTMLGDSPTGPQMQLPGID